MSSNDRASSIRRELFLRALAPGGPPAAAARRLAEAMQELRYAAGEVVFEQGEPADRVLFVVEGELEMSADGLEPRVYGPGSVVGVFDLNVGRPRLRTTRALTVARVIELGADDLWEMFEDHAEHSNHARRRLSHDHHLGLLELSPDGGFSEPSDDPYGAWVSLAPAVVERLVVLRATPYFERASIQAVVELAERAEPLRARRGDLLFPPGAASDVALVVVAGVLEIERRIAPPLVARFGPGELVLGGAGFSGALVEYAVSAPSHAVVLCLRYSDIDDVCEDHPELTRSILRGMTLHLEHTLAERERRLASTRSTPPAPGGFGPRARA